MGIGWTDGAIEADQAGELPVRVYRDSRSPRSAPLVFHLHGGAFCSGSLEVCETIPELLAEAGAVVVSADYPLAPEFQFPHALRTIFGALKNLHKSRARWASKVSRLFVAGEGRQPCGVAGSDGARPARARSRRTDPAIADARPVPCNHLNPKRRCRSRRLQVGGWLAALSRISGQGRTSLRGALSVQSSFGFATRADRLRAG